MKCGDAIAYVLPSLSYEIGDHISPISGRGEWVIVTERYASRIGNLSIFRALGLERYTPGTTLKGVYTVVEPAIAGVDIVGMYALIEDPVLLEMLSRYDINALEVPGIMLASKYDLTEVFVPLDIISSYTIIAYDSLYPSTPLYPSTTLYPRGTGRVHEIMGIEFTSKYDIYIRVLGIEFTSKYDIYIRVLFS
jgi:hypothetical protein